MYIIITGAGSFGLSAAEKLANENHEIALVDRNPDKIEHISNTIDCKTVCGGASSLKTLKEAGIQKADMVLAMTNDDHVNILTCMIAREYNIQRKIAKISDPEFYADDHILRFKEQRIFELMVSPEKAAADEIIKLLEMPMASEFSYYAKGMGAVAAFQMEDGHPFIGKQLQELKELGIGMDFLIAAIDRGNDTIIPKGDDSISLNDTIYMAGARDKIREFALEKAKIQSRQIMIVGGRNLSFRIASALENHFQVKIIEPDYDSCEKLSTELKRTIVLNGEGTDTSLLKSEKIDSCRALLCCTSDEESNILIGLLGKSLGAQKAICLTQKQEYSKLVGGLGIDATISPRTAAISEITKYVRKGQVEKVISFNSNNVEAIEFVAGPNSKVTSTTIQNLGLPSNIVLGGIVKNNEFHLPTGSSKVETGDHVIVFVLPEHIKEIEAFFSNEI
jgi:trk system potassium uptake protein TrkA